MESLNSYAFSFHGLKWKNVLWALSTFIAKIPTNCLMLSEEMATRTHVIDIHTF